MTHPLASSHVFTVEDGRRFTLVPTDQGCTCTGCAAEKLDGTDPALCWQLNQHCGNQHVFQEVKK